MFTFVNSGELKIAEVVSRFSDINTFIEVLSELGFKLVKKVRKIIFYKQMIVQVKQALNFYFIQDDTNIMFIMFDFVKTKSRKTKKSKLYNATDLLKPCVYKKR